MVARGQLRDRAGALLAVRQPPAPAARSMMLELVRMVAVALAVLVCVALAGCASTRPTTTCETVAVIPNEFVVVHCPYSGARNGIIVIRWSELVGPWPVER